MQLHRTSGVQGRCNLVFRGPCDGGGKNHRLRNQTAQKVVLPLIVQALVSLALLTRRYMDAEAGHQRELSPGILEWLSRMLSIRPSSHDNSILDNYAIYHYNLNKNNRYTGWRKKNKPDQSHLGLHLIQSAFFCATLYQLPTREGFK